MSELTRNATLAAYEADAPTYCARYESLGASPESRPPEALETLYRRWVLPGARVLELGCGSGRDARFMARLGADVTATDGSEAMLAEAQRLAGSGATGTGAAPGSLRFVHLELPPSEGLRVDTAAALHALGAAKPFDVVTSSGVLQHLDASELYETAAFIASVTSEKGVVLVAVPTEHPGDGATSGRFFSNLPAAHYTSLFERLGFSLVALSDPIEAGPKPTPALWRTMVFLRETGRVRAGTSLFGIVEQDSKTATYKFALLKTLCDLNIRSSGGVRFLSDKEMRHIAASTTSTASDAALRILADPRVAVPFYGVVELWIENYWRLYAPEVVRAPKKSDDDLLKDAPRQVSGSRRPGFVAPLFDLIRDYQGDLWRLKQDLYSGAWTETALGPLRAKDSKEYDLRVRRRTLYAKLVTSVASTVKDGPVRYAGNSLSENLLTVLSDANRLFSVRPYEDVAGGGKRRTTKPATPDDFRLRCGELVFPADLWRELTAVAPWLTDSVALGWAKLSHRFSVLSGATHTSSEILERLIPEPDQRSTTLARTVYLDRIRNQGLVCVWSELPLTDRTLDVDHVIPWAKSRSNDLWNLLPAESSVNRGKSDRLPSAALLYESRNRVFDDWTLLADRYEALFFAQAASAFPAAGLSAVREPRWETKLFDALLEATDTVALQYHADRWRPSAPSP
ncbi:methyltransferase domain-containing protein [Sutterella megalosphaeroides]|uniref:Type 11 methyltransferase n=1 Tax=Sutterella megalosphaeroides TaxID=2494234 RepID=A0A2Z6I9C2_9BURK|nr:methyltransferase domain-containing protein [Sutterella megalosphaeroides]BBF23091.1 type 11 methyltransferase [Sutterella megalosphaeroides]